MRENVRAARLRLSRNVKELRQLRKLSQERLAELAGTTNKSVSEIERGVTNAGMDQIASIATALSVNIGDLFEPTPLPASNVRSVLMTVRELEQADQTLTLLARRIKRAKRG